MGIFANCAALACFHTLTLFVYLDRQGAHGVSVADQERWRLGVIDVATVAIIAQGFADDIGHVPFVPRLTPSAVVYLSIPFGSVDEVAAPDGPSFFLVGRSLRLATRANVSMWTN